MSKKLSFLLILLFICFAIFSRTSFATTERIVIFPVDKTISGSTLTPYPSVINLVSSEVANTLSKHSKYSIIDLKSSENLIKSKGLYSKYKNLLEIYKNSYTLDYDTLGLIGDKLGASKILIISGGYDLQAVFLARNWKDKISDSPRLFIPLVGSDDVINPSYRLNIILTLVDAQSGIVVWEKAYNKNISINNYSYPSPSFGESPIATQQIKKFARYLAYEAIIEMKFYLARSKSLQVHSEVTSTQTPISTGKTRDGLTTKDGHSYSTDNDYLINKRKNNYKNWVKDSL